MIASIPELITFLKQFHRHWLDEPGLDPALIPADIPDGLATIYRELGALIAMDPAPDEHICPFATQDALVPVGDLKRVDGMIEFAWENQGNWSARCSLGPGDPPVYSNAADAWDSKRRGFIVVCESLNDFLITLCLQEAVMSCRHLAALRTSHSPDQVLTVPVRPLWLNGHYVSGQPDHHFFVSQDQDVLVMDWWAGVWVGSLVRSVRGFVDEGGECRVLR